ncbi:Hypothetical_protein [Hexamita inflata]|uniref:Hypothetical_protein n=1 Tax=Hexamita inflata TaxID=28002 RepID=A0AA86UCH2_9EUKA|nr:Hypothetical protein HINF_LOCUS37904 [Hexamita inflata]
MNIHNIVLETDQTISCAQYVQNQTLFSTTKTFFIQSESELYNKYKFKAPIIYFKFLTDKIILVQTIDRVYIRDTEYGAQIALGNHGLVLSADGVKDNDTIVIAVIVSRLQPVLEMYYYNQTTRQVAARPEALRVYNRTSLVQIYGFDARTEVVQMLLKGDYVQLEGIYANKDSKMDKRFFIIQANMVASEKEISCFKVLNNGILVVASKDNIKFLEVKYLKPVPRSIDDNKIKLDFEAPQINHVVETEEFFYFATDYQLIKVPQIDIMEEKSQRLLDLAVNIVSYQNRIIGIEQINSSSKDEIVVIHAI